MTTGRIPSQQYGSIEKDKHRVRAEDRVMTDQFWKNHLDKRGIKTHVQVDDYASLVAMDMTKQTSVKLQELLETLG